MGEISINKIVFPRIVYQLNVFFPQISTVFLVRWNYYNFMKKRAGTYPKVPYFSYF